MHKPVEIFAGKVFFSTKEYFEDKITLKRAPEPGRPDMFKKNAPFYLKLVLFLCHSQVPLILDTTISISISLWKL